MRLLSIDVGIRNLAFATIDVDKTTDNPLQFCIHDWGVFDLCPESDVPATCVCCSAKSVLQVPSGIQMPTTVCKKGKTVVVIEVGSGLCVTHANKLGIYHQKQSKAATLVHLKTVYANRLSIPTIQHNLSNKPELNTWQSIVAFFKVPTTEQTGVREVYNWVKSHTGTIIQRIDATKIKTVDAGIRFAELSRQRKLFDGVDMLVIENQIGSVAVRMKAMQDMISVIASFAGVPKTVGVSSSGKLSTTTQTQQIVTPIEQSQSQSQCQSQKSVYSKHKSDGITRCREWIQTLTGSDKLRWSDVFEGSKKKDDMADSLLQAIWMCKTTNAF